MRIPAIRSGIGSKVGDLEIRLIAKACETTARFNGGALRLDKGLDYLIKAQIEPLRPQAQQYLTIHHIINNGYVLFATPATMRKEPSHSEVEI